MKIVKILSLIFLVSAVGAKAAELHSQVIIQTGNHYPGENYNGGPLGFDWVNNWGQPIHIKRVQYFMGAYMGMLLDFDADLSHVWANGYADYVMRCEWDHYSDPTSSEANNPHVDFGNDCVTVNPGERLHLSVQTNGPVDPNKFWGIQVCIWFTFNSGL